MDIQPYRWKISASDWEWVYNCIGGELPSGYWKWIFSRMGRIKRDRRKEQGVTSKEREDEISYISDKIWRDRD